MDHKILSKRRTNGQIKVNNDVTPAKIRKKEVNLEQLTKLKVIEKYKQLDKLYQTLLVENEKKNIEIESLKSRFHEFETKANDKCKSRSIEIQTGDITDDLSFNCNECLHTANCEKALRWHIFQTHNKGNPEITMNYSCNNCHQKFHQKKDLMFHVKREHTEGLAICKFFKEGKCNFSSQTCWFLHPQNVNNPVNRTSYKCNNCEQLFESISEVMKHRKEHHNKIIQLCRNFKNESCKFGNDCWYNHKIEQKSNHQFGKSFVEGK